METPNEVTFLKASDVMAKTKLPKTTIYERAARGEFPKPIKAGARASFWPAHEVDRWCRAVIAGATKERLCELVTELHEAR
ncbi:MAG: AlpA family phage regulatory protein, partial [Myxococcales bacterium]|nr:AlpA family phage regulatory protein [Myxococcales bacterium]